MIETRHIQKEKEKRKILTIRTTILITLIMTKTIIAVVTTLTVPTTTTKINNH